MQVFIDEHEEAVQNHMGTTATADVGQAESKSIHFVLNQADPSEVTSYCEAPYALGYFGPFGSHYFREFVRVGVTEEGSIPEINSGNTISNTPDLSTSTPATDRGSNWADDLLRSILEETSARLIFRLRQQLSGYLSLPKDWDGYGGIPTTKVAAKLAEQILSHTTSVASRFRVETTLGPLADGGLDIEWNSIDGHGLLVEVPPGADYLNYVVSRKMTDGTFKYENGKLDDVGQVAPLIKQLV